MAFSAAQTEAVHFKDGPCMVLAGPGSGKTTVITNRLLHLIYEEGIDPAEILVITFTRLAAREMEDRFQKLCRERHGHCDLGRELGGGIRVRELGGAIAGSSSVRKRNGTGERHLDRTENPPVTFGTFHSVFFSILASYRNLSPQNIVRGQDRLLILRMLTDQENIDVSFDPDFFRKLSSEIAIYKELLPEERRKFSSELLEQDTFQCVYDGYIREMQRRRLIDFEDMLTGTLQLFKERPDALASCRERFRYVLVDEFQDINRTQYEIVKLIARPRNNLFIVGDDDQSIYAFRGARPEIMLGFEKDFPGTRKIILSENYRSRAEITAFTSRLIARNRRRFEKSLCSARGAGGRVLRFDVPDTVKEYRFLASEVRKEMEAGIPMEEIAVLFRTNSSARPLLNEFMQEGIPFVCQDRVQNPYEHFAVRDLLSYLRLSMGKGTRGDFIRIMNRPLRYISRESVGGRRNGLSDIEAFYQDKPWMLEKIVKLRNDLRVIGTLPSAAALSFIMKQVGYEEWLQEFASEHRADYQSYQDVIGEIREEALDHPDKTEWLSFAAGYGERLTEEMRNCPKNGIRLMTYHASKGLEFRIVHLIDCVEDLTPYRKAGTPAELEEERRMFYVACTRAEEELHIYVTGKRYSKRCVESRFVKEGSDG